MKGRSNLLWGTVMAAMLTGSGCQSPSHLLFHQNTVLGVDVATSAEGGTVHATVAYDRQTTAFVPKTKIRVTKTTSDGKERTTEQYEAMSVISKSELDIHFLSTSEIHEIFATGDAAINIARHPKAIDALVQHESNSQ